MDASFTGHVFLGMSVDGFIARLDGDIAWLTGGADENAGPDDGEGGDFGFGEFVGGIDALVMGRATYDVIAPFDEWPYQGVYREDRNPSPVGYRVGGTAIACLGLAAAPGLANDAPRSGSAAISCAIVKRRSPSCSASPTFTPRTALSSDIFLATVCALTLGRTCSTPLSSVRVWHCSRSARHHRA